MVQTHTENVYAKVYSVCSILYAHLKLMVQLYATHLYLNLMSEIP